MSLNLFFPKFLKPVEITISVRKELAWYRTFNSYTLAKLHFHFLFQNLFVEQVFVILSNLTFIKVD